MTPFRRSLADLRRNGRADEVLLPNEEALSDEYHRLLDAHLELVAPGDPDPSAIDWHVARQVTALRWRCERESHNAVSTRNELEAAATPSERRRRELAEATERQAIFTACDRQVRQVLETDRMIREAFPVIASEAGQVVPFKKRAARG